MQRPQIRSLALAALVAAAPAAAQSPEAKPAAEPAAKPAAPAAQAPAARPTAPAAQQPAAPPGAAPAAKPSVQDELGPIVNIQDAAARHKALRELIAGRKPDETVYAAHFFLVRSLLVTNGPSREIADAARAALAALPPADPEYFEPRMQVALSAAEALINRGEALDVAGELVRTALAGVPKDDERGPRIRAVLHVMTAKIQSKQGNRDAAIATLRQASVDSPDDQMLLTTLGQELEAAGRQDEAIDAYIRAETVFGGEATDLWALRDLYAAKNGSLAGLGERVEKARMESLRRVALDSRRVDKPAPDWVLTDMSGAKVALKDLRGQVVVLDFWATWCGPCREELPSIEALNASFAGKPVRFLAINSEGGDDPKAIEATVRGFVAKNEMTLRVLPDYDGKVNEAYGVEAIPTKIVIDQEGVIRYRNVGTNDTMKQILKAQIGSLVRQPVARNQ